MISLEIIHMMTITIVHCEDYKCHISSKQDYMKLHIFIPLAMIRTYIISLILQNLNYVHNKYVTVSAKPSMFKYKF